MTVVDFQRALRSMPAPILMLRPGAGFAIVEASDAWLRETSMVRDDVVGRKLFEVFPFLADTGHDGAPGLEALLNHLVASRSEQTTCLASYVHAHRVGADTEERYWTVNAPVLSDDGEVQYVIHRVDDSRRRSKTPCRCSA